MIHNKTQALVKAIQGISRSRRPNEVFRDFVELTAIQISNRVDPVHFKRREEIAVATQAKYNAIENRRMQEAYHLLCDIIIDKLSLGIFEDVLGRVFRELCVPVKGQEFTPDSLSRLIARLEFEKSYKLPESGFITLNEPTCAAGIMVLDVASWLDEIGINCFTQFAALAVDIEIRAVYMTYIQLSLYGIPAVVLRGDTIACREYDRWWTPIYVLNDWVWKAPLGFTTDRHADDELLKRATDPMYNAMRRMGL